MGGGLQLLGAEPSPGLDGGGGVDQAAPPGVVTAAAGAVPGGVLQEAFDLDGGQLRVGGPDEGDGAGDGGRGGAGAPPLVVAAVGVGEDDVVAGGADRGVPAAGGEGGAFAEAVDGGDGDDARVGRRVGDVVALLAAVPGGGDDHGALLQGVLDGGVLGGLGVGGLAVVAEGEVDDVGALVGGPADALGQRAAPGGAGLLAGGVAVLQDHPDREDLGLGGDAHHAVAVLGPVAVTGDDRGHGGAVAGPGPVTGTGAEPYEVLAVQDVALQVGVVGVDAGVQDRDGDALALGGAPGVLGVERLQAPLLGADAVGVGDGGQQGEAGGDGRYAEGAEDAGGSGHGHRSSVSGRARERRRAVARSVWASAVWPRPAWAGAVVAPSAVAEAAGWGSVISRPSAKPLTA